jgi:hypothetical protein
MSSKGETRLPALERLRGAENYHSWKSQVFNILEGKSLKEYIKQACIKPKPIETTTLTLSTTPKEILLPLESTTVAA